MKIRKHIISLILLFSFFSCEYNFPEESVLTEEDFGELNTENIIAVGDDFMAGLMDGALYSDGQENSLPAILSKQFSNVNSVDFIQPSINSENGYNIYESDDNSISGKWISVYEDQTAEEAVLKLTQGDEISDYSGDKDELNNLAFPEFYLRQFGEDELKENKFFSRIFSDTETGVVQQIIKKEPSLIIAWMGMNDYISYAMKGATDSSELTSVSDFQEKLESFVETIFEETSSDLVIGNLISFEDFPFFYLNQYDFIRITDRQKSSAISAYASFNNAVEEYNKGKIDEEQRPYIDFDDNGTILYPQALVVIDETLPDAYYPGGAPLEKYRQLTEGELALFSITDEMVEAGLGWLEPLDDEYYLSADQISEIGARVNAFNQVLNNLQQEYPDRIVVVDLASAVKKISETSNYDSWGGAVSDAAFYENGVPIEGGIDLNSIFSLDAIHFNQRGNAFIANVFLKAINNSFNANIPSAEINTYIGNVYTFE